MVASLYQSTWRRSWTGTAQECWVILLWEPYPSFYNGLFSPLLVQRFRCQKGRSLSVLYELYETSYLFYVTLSFLCNIICYLISVFVFSLVTLSGATADIFKESLKQHPTKQQIHSHLPPIPQTIQVKWAKHAGFCWRSDYELTSDILLWNPSHQYSLNSKNVYSYPGTWCCLEDLPRWIVDLEVKDRVKLATLLDEGLANEWGTTMFSFPYQDYGAQSYSPYNSHLIKERNKLFSSRPLARNEFQIALLSIRTWVTDYIVHDDYHYRNCKYIIRQYSLVQTSLAKWCRHMSIQFYQDPFQHPEKCSNFSFELVSYRQYIYIYIYIYIYLHS